MTRACRARGVSVLSQILFKTILSPKIARSRSKTVQLFSSKMSSMAQVHFIPSQRGGRPATPNGFFTPGINQALRGAPRSGYLSGERHAVAVSTSILMRRGPLLLKNTPIQQTMGRPRQRRE